MSLIDEALKRARQEAARQDEAAREKRYRQVPVIPGLRQPPRRSWLLLPGVMVAYLAGGIGIGLIVASRRGDDQRAAVPPPVAVPAAPAPATVDLPAESPQETEAAPVPQPPPAPVIEEEPVPPVAEERPAPTPPQQEEPVIADMRQREIALSPAPARPEAPPEAIRESEPPAPSPPVVTAPEPAAPEPALAPATPGQERVYQQELPLPGGGSLRLNGIAFSEQPVALFGDKVVGPGETVAGYKVVAIEVHRVRLEGQGGVVVVEMP